MHKVGKTAMTLCHFTSCLINRLAAHQPTFLQWLEPTERLYFTLLLSWMSNFLISICKYVAKSNATDVPIEAQECCDNGNPGRRRERERQLWTRGNVFFYLHLTLSDHNFTAYKECSVIYKHYATVNWKWFWNWIGKILFSLQQFLLISLYIFSPFVLLISLISISYSMLCYNMRLFKHFDLSSRLLDHSYIWETYLMTTSQNHTTVSVSYTHLDVYKRQAF